MSSSIIEIFSSNPVPSEKTFLSELEGNNLHPLRHSLKGTKKKKKKKTHTHTPKFTTETSWKAMVSHYLYIYFLYGMYWSTYVYIHFYVGSWNQL